jgi:hypothetical protein
MAGFEPLALQCGRPHIARQTFHETMVRNMGDLEFKRRNKPAGSSCKLAIFTGLIGWLRRQRARPRLRPATRASQSRMIYERLHRALSRWQKGGRILPQSSLGKAITYTLGQWASLAVYLQDGTIEIDNNLVENAIRPTVLETS